MWWMRCFAAGNNKPDASFVPSGNGKGGKIIGLWNYCTHATGIFAVICIYFFTACSSGPVRVKPSETDGLNRTIETLKAENDQLRKENAALLEKLSAVQQTARQLVVKAPEDPAGVNGGGRARAAIAATTMYREAFHLYHNLSFEESRKMFEGFLNIFPGHHLCGNARYWIGECRFMQKQYEKAGDSFMKVLENYRGSPKSADALLMLGRSFFKLGDDEKAAQCWNSVTRHYPRSRAAGFALRYLGR